MSEPKKLSDTIPRATPIPERPGYVLTPKGKIMKESSYNNMLKGSLIAGGHSRKGKKYSEKSMKGLLKKILFEEQNGKTALEALLLVIRREALRGNLRAAELLFERYDRLILGVKKDKQVITDATITGFQIIEVNATEVRTESETSTSIQASE